MKRLERNRQARRILDNNTIRLTELQGIAPPKNGWVRAIREALGMSREQLGSRMRSSRKPHTSRGISASAVQSIERQESSGAVTLDSLKRSAEAMGCSLVYALIPNRSLEDMVQQQAQLVADRLAKETRQTMKLEAQDYTAPLLDSGVIETLINSHILWNNHD